MKPSFIVCTALLFACNAWADCPVPERKVTQAEERFYATTIHSLKALLPPAPHGWELQDKAANRPVLPLGTLCANDTDPISAYYVVTYYNAATAAELSRKDDEITQKIHALRRFSPEQERRMKAVELRSRDLRWEARKLAATDKAAADKKIAEARELTVQANEIRREVMMRPEIQTLEKEQQALRAANLLLKVELTITVNTSDGTHLSALAPRTAQGGAQLASSHENKTVLAWGPWNKNQHDVYRLKTPPGPTDKVYGIVVSVSGERRATDQILAGLDRKALKALLENRDR